MPTPTLKLPPLLAFRKQVQAFSRDTATAAAGALREEHELIMTAAKRQTPVAIPGVTVPKDYQGTPGALRASGVVFPTERVGTRLVSLGGFGGAAKSYAVYVHEILTNRHQVRKAKFYEDALLAAARGLDRRLAAGIARRMRA